MNTLCLWLSSIGSAVFAVLLVALAVGLRGYAEWSQVAVRLAVVLSVIGVVFACAMAGAIAWGQVRTVSGRKQSPRLHACQGVAADRASNTLVASFHGGTGRETPAAADRTQAQGATQ